MMVGGAILHGVWLILRVELLLKRGCETGSRAADLVAK